MDFNAAGQPGRGSNVGDFVRGKGGGWVPRNHPDAQLDEEPQRHALPTEEAAPVAPGGGAGTEVDTSGMSAAMAGLRSAAAPPPPPGMTQNISAPGDANPNLGQRILPINMRQLAMMLPRIY